MKTLNEMKTLNKIRSLIDTIFIDDFNLNFEGLGAEENLEQLVNDPFNSSFIHWLEGFKTGYEKSLIISNNIRDSSYSLTSCQADYNDSFNSMIIDSYLKENPQYTVDDMYDANGVEYDYYESDCIEWYNADIAYLSFTLYENKKGDIIAQLSLNYAFLDGHARHNDVILAKVEYSKDEFNGITSDKIISDINGLLLG